jgi:hypothetical protein
MKRPGHKYALAAVLDVVAAVGCLEDGARGAVGEEALA